MARMTQEEMWAFNVLNSSVGNAQAELNRAAAARDAYIKLLEAKYEAIFDPATGELKPKEQDKKDAIRSRHHNTSQHG